MGAYNWIEFEYHCPNCDQKALGKAQIHLVSSYDGDDTGRFFERAYHVGDTMSWWEANDHRFDAWRDERNDVSLDDASEICFAECLSCGAGFNVVVTLRSFVIMDVSPTDKAVP